MMGKGDGVQLFDVREPEELEKDGRIPGAVNIPRKLPLINPHFFCACTTI